MTADSIALTATFDELCTWEANGLAVYATPAQGDPTYTAQVYVGSRPNFMGDFCLATVQDFCAAVGWTSIGWEEMSREDLAAVASDELTLTVPRRKPVEEA